MLSVIIPVYKAKETITDTLDSLVAQTRRIFQVIFVQDCDGEDYTEIISEYRRRGLHIKHIQQPTNMGPGMARQTGIDAATSSDYIVFVDSDDILNPRALDVMYKEARASGFDVLSTDIVVENMGANRKTGTIGKTFVFDKNHNTVVWCHNKIYRRQYLIDNDIRFIPELRVNEDSYFNLLAINCTDKVGYVHEPTYVWRNNENSLTRKDKENKFFKIGYIQYSYSQTIGLVKVYKNWIKRNKDLEKMTPLVAATLINLYKTMMVAKYYNLPLDHIYSNIRKMKDFDFDFFFSQENFWDYLLQNLPAAERKEDEVIFYSQRFIDWYTEIVKEAKGE